MVVTLLVQTSQLQTEVDKNNQIKRFTEMATEIARQYMQAESSLYPTQSEPTQENFERFESGRKQLPKLIDEARKVASSQSFKNRAYKLLNTLEKHKERVLDTSKEFFVQRELLKQAGVPEQFHDRMDDIYFSAIGETMGADGNIALKFAESFKNIQVELRDLQAASPKVQQKIREQERIFLLVALGGSFVLALQLAFFFSTGIVKRLDTITDNTARLRDGRELNPRITGSDEITLLDTVFHDMTSALREAQEKERQMLEKLMVAEARVRTIIENMPVGVMLLDETGIIESVNPRIEELFACEATGLVEKQIETLFESDPAAAGEDKVLDRLRAMQGRPVEKTALKADGTFFAALTLNEIQTFEGKRFLLSIQDVTERHELEKLKQEFYAMIAHDLRTPLMSAQMSLSVVNDGILGEVPPKIKTTIDRAENGIKRLTNLINDFLDFEKLQAGKFDLNLKPMYLSSLMERSASEVRGLADKYGLKIEIADEEAMTYADEERLIQVLINLLSNAIKFSPENEVIKINLENKGKEVLISVVDKGPGIPEELRNNLFKSFSMLKNNKPASTRIKGTGLGLAICKMIVEQHGGTIGVDSKVGEGSTFWFKLPIRTS